MSKLLCISPGHGGTDSGATAFGYLEKDLTLIISKRVAELLKEYNPNLIRNKDITLDSSARSTAIKSKYQYCLDIHLNAANGKGTGIETIHSIYSTKGKALAEVIAQQLKNAIDLPIRRVFSREGKNGDYYYMHRLTGCTTTVIVECLFLDNQEDVNHLNIEKIATAIANGFKIFMANQETQKPSIKNYEPAKCYKIASTEIVEIDPIALKISIQDKAANKIALPNFVTAGYQMMQANGEAYPLGILVSEGEVMQNRQPHNKPAGTLIVYKDGTVDVKPILDISTETNVWFAVSGCTILPKIRMTEEGFVGQFSDIGRKTSRPVIGWNPEKNKVIIAVRPDSDISRAQLTLINLGCTKGITLDAGGSTVLRVDNDFLFNTTRQLHSVITW